jgi:hypothetical protein
MRALVIAAVSLTGATLVAGPIAYLRTQRQIARPQPSLAADTNLPASPALEAEFSRPLIDSVRVTGELVHAEQIATPLPATARAPMKPAERRRAIPTPRKSLFARVLFGTSGYRPSPFPRPGS